MTVLRSLHIRDLQKELALKINSNLAFDDELWTNGKNFTFWHLLENFFFTITQTIKSSVPLKVHRIRIGENNVVY